MIVNEVPNHADTKIHLMRTSDIQFYMTGSRYSGTANEESDYDYFTEYSSTTIRWLRSNGFCQIQRDFTSYHDPSIIQVWRYVSMDILMEQVDVQLIKPSYMLAKRKANEFLLQGEGLRYYHACKDKIARSLMWGMMISDFQWRISRKLV